MPKIVDVVGRDNVPALQQAAATVIVQLSHELVDALHEAITVKLASLNRIQKSASPRFAAVAEQEAGVYHGLKALLTEAKNQASSAETANVKVP